MRFPILDRALVCTRSVCLDRRVPTRRCGHATTDYVAQRARLFSRCLWTGRPRWHGRCLRPQSSCATLTVRRQQSSQARPIAALSHRAMPLRSPSRRASTGALAAVTANAIGCCHRHRGELEFALEYFTRAAAIDSRCPCPRQPALTQLNVRSPTAFIRQALRRSLTLH
jgi:hypothetical protein